VELSRYIHLNPVKAGMVSKPEHYQWSSYQSYIGQCATPEWLKTNFILGYFGRKASDANNSYRRFVEDLLDNEYESPLSATVASTVLGRSAFVREVSERHLGEKRAERSMLAVKALALRPSLVRGKGPLDLLDAFAGALPAYCSLDGLRLGSLLRFSRPRFFLGFCALLCSPSRFLEGRIL
jgi:hypothetical protein